MSIEAVFDPRAALFPAVFLPREKDQTPADLYLNEIEIEVQRLTDLFFPATKLETGAALDMKVMNDSVGEGQIDIVIEIDRFFEKRMDGDGNADPNNIRIKWYDKQETRELNLYYDKESRALAYITYDHAYPIKDIAGNKGRVNESVRIVNLPNEILPESGVFFSQRLLEGGILKKSHCPLSDLPKWKGPLPDLASVLLRVNHLLQNHKPENE